MSEAIDQAAEPTSEQTVLIRDIDLLSMLQAILIGTPALGRLFGGRIGLGQKLDRLMIGVYWLFKWILPCTSIDLSHNLQEKQLWRLFWTFTLAAFVLSFVAISLLTLSEGRFLEDTDPCTINFLEDSTNIVLYASVVPLYVGLGIVLILVSIRHWYSLIDVLDRQTTTEGIKVWRNVSSFLAVVVLCIMLTVLYINDSFDPARIPNTSDAACTYPQASGALGESFTYYWFLNEAGRANLAGYYYAILNFILQFLTVAAGLCFISVNIDAVRYINFWKSSLSEKLTPQRVARQIKFLDSAYILAKLLASVYIVNIFLWKGSPLGCLHQTCTLNVRLAEMFMVVVGFILVNFPRRYVVHMVEQFYKTNAPEDEFKVKFLGLSDVIDDRAAYWKNYPGGLWAAVLVTLIDFYLLSAFVEVFIDSGAIRDWLMGIGVKQGP